MLSIFYAVWWSGLRSATQNQGWGGGDGLPHLVLLWLKWEFGDLGHDDVLLKRTCERMKQTQARGSFVEVDSWEDEIFRKNVNMTRTVGRGSCFGSPCRDSVEFLPENSSCYAVASCCSLRLRLISGDWKFTLNKLPLLVCVWCLLSTWNEAADLCLVVC